MYFSANTPFNLSKSTEHVRGYKYCIIEVNRGRWSIENWTIIPNPPGCKIIYLYNGCITSVDLSKPILKDIVWRYRYAHCRTHTFKFFWIFMKFFNFKINPTVSNKKNRCYIKESHATVPFSKNIHNLYLHPWNNCRIVQKITSVR